MVSLCPHSQPKSSMAAVCSTLPHHPDPQMPARLLALVENLLSQTGQLMSKGSKMHQKNQNSDKKGTAALLKPYIPWTSLSLTFDTSPTCPWTSISFIFYTMEIITEDSEETGRLGKMCVQTLWINCAVTDLVDYTSNPLEKFIWLQEFLACFCL